MNTELFGTDGVRGAYGAGFFVPEKLARLARAIGSWIADTQGTRRPVFIIRDTRSSSPAIVEVVVHELCAAGLSVVDGGVLPTGAAWHVGRSLDASCSLIISASHNPPDDNGIKIVDCSYGKISQSAEKEIEARYYSPQASANAGAHRLAHLLADAAELYIAAILARYPSGMLAGHRIVVDCAEGAMSAIAPQVFERLGAHVVPCAAAGDGRRINVGVGATSPAYISAQTRSHEAILGCAFDGDGDRLVIATRDGKTLSGDDLLVYYAQHPRYVETHAVVGTILVNSAVEKYLAAAGKELRRVGVGDRAVAESLSADALYGGEPSGHYLFADQGPLSDGLFSALNFLELCVAKKCFDWEPITRFPVRMATIAYVHKKDLTSLPIRSYIEDAEQHLSGGRIVVRYSGTEPILRIFGEGPQEETVAAVVQNLTTLLVKELS